MLGWSDREALTTPIPRIYVAARARMKWRMGAPYEQDDPAEKIASALRMIGK